MTEPATDERIAKVLADIRRDSRDEATAQALEEFAARIEAEKARAEKAERVAEKYAHRTMAANGRADRLVKELREDHLRAIKAWKDERLEKVERIAELEESKRQLVLQRDDQKARADKFRNRIAELERIIRDARGHNAAYGGDTPLEEILARAEGGEGE